ncbi:MAG: hypothetical protein LBC74_11040 [Planctomycetaceae bacterium]|jgi:hypothetical protein|nr:hypothetical protein [Planctomycetaceae bacterium]
MLLKIIRAVFFTGVFLFCELFTTVNAEEVADKNEPKIVIPNDAIIIPYSLDNLTPNKLPKPDNLIESDQTVIVPIDLHLGMLDLIKSIDKIRLNSQLPSPTRITAAAAEYTATELPQTGNEFILNGKIHIYQFKNEGTLLPFHLQNCIIESPRLNNKPASVSSVSNSKFVLYVSGQGEHIFTFKVRIKIQQQGGWRIAEGILPTASTSKVQLTLPSEAGDLLTRNPLDVRKWTSGKDKTGTKKTITTTLEPNGNFAWRWRAAISEGQVDRSLEVESVIRFDLQEDAAWILWMPKFKISRGKWETLRLQVSSNYTIAEVTGENVRGWNIVTKNNEADDNTQILNIDLLKPAEKEETLQVRLMRIEPDNKSGRNETWKLSTLSVPEAGIHRGRIDLHRSSIRKFRVTEVKGVVLTDQPRTPVPITTAKFNTTSPLGEFPFQSYRFISEPFDLTFNSELIERYADITFQSILKVSHKRSILETKIIISPQGRPFFVTIKLPQQFKLKNVIAPNTLFYSSEIRNGENLLYVSHGNRATSSVIIGIEGEYIPIAPVVQIEDKDNTNKPKNSSPAYQIDRLPVFSAEFAGIASERIYKSATIELLTDPSLSAKAVNLKNCELNNSRTDSGNIRSPKEQWELVQLILNCFSFEYNAKLLFNKVDPEVRCSTITNVRTTSEAINETILFDFNINRAGIREVKFTLPEWMKDAVIEAPFLQRKKITEREIKIDGTVLKVSDVTLELQESVIDYLRVLVHADRKLRAEKEYRIFVPIIETGIATSQYVVMENDRMSLDEMVVDQATIKNLKNLDRRQQEWQYLATMLGENVTEAYYVQKNNSDYPNNNNAAANASLTFKMKRRDAVRLSEARINKAETRLVFDLNGEYRVEQIYHIDNQKEPYLDIFLPEAASLWGVRFFTADAWQQRDSLQNNSNPNRPEGTPVKPCLMPFQLARSYDPKILQVDQKDCDFVVPQFYLNAARIPLIKTDSGDLDYVVRIVYAGTSRKVKNFSSAEMPFIKVLNVPVGTSLLKLYLPKEYKYFFHGNMQHVNKEQTDVIIKKINDDYTQQLGTRLQQTIEKDNVYAQQRAWSNMKNSTLLQNDFYNDTTNQRGIANQQNLQSLQQQPQIVTHPQQFQQQMENTDSNSNSISNAGSNAGTLRNQFINQSNTLSSQIVNKKSIAIQMPTAQTTVTIEKQSGPLNQLMKANSESETVNNKSLQAASKDMNKDMNVDEGKGTRKSKIDNIEESQQRSQAVYNDYIVLGNTKQLYRQLAIAENGTTEKNDNNAKSNGVELMEERSLPTSVETVDNLIIPHPAPPEMSQKSSDKSNSPPQFVSGAVITPANSFANDEKFRSLSTRMTGLDIDVPYNGELYIFMTPQGSLDLSFRAVSQDFKLRGICFLASLFCAGIVYIGYKGCLVVGKRFVLDRRVNLRLGILSLLLMLLSFLVGMIVIFVVISIAAIILWINFFFVKFAKN